MSTIERKQKKSNSQYRFRQIESKFFKYFRKLLRTRYCVVTNTATTKNIVEKTKKISKLTLMSAIIVRTRNMCIYFSIYSMLLFMWFSCSTKNLTNLV